MIGLAVPIPILNMKIAQNCAIRDQDIQTVIRDAADDQNMDDEKPIVCKVNYKELKSGKVCLPNGKTIASSSVSSIFMSEKLIKELNRQILEKEFYLTPCLEKIPRSSYQSLKPLKMRVINQ